MSLWARMGRGCFFAEDDYRFFLDHLVQIEVKSAQCPVPSGQKRSRDDATVVNVEKKGRGTRDEGEGDENCVTKATARARREENGVPGTGNGVFSTRSWGTT